MNVLFAGQVPKDLMFPEANEDALALAAERGIIAVSDGASESYDSKKWAILLATRFALFPDLNPTWLNAAVEDYLDRIDHNQMTWSKQAAFERGSFATLLGVEQNSADSKLNVYAVGDSIAVLLDGDDFIDSFPYTRAEEFQKRPDLFCTNASLNSLFSSTNSFIRYLKTWSLEKMNNPVLLCMTDALAEWALRSEEGGCPVWQVLKGIEDVTELESLVLRERLTKNMRVDDITLVRISFLSGM